MSVKFIFYFVKEVLRSVTDEKEEIQSIVVNMLSLDIKILI